MYPKRTLIILGNFNLVVVLLVLFQNDCDCTMSVFLVAVLLIAAVRCEEQLSSVSAYLLGDFKSISFHECLGTPKQCL